MSQDERLMILQMVADKKISASEAAELLKALDSKEADAPAPKAAPHGTHQGHSTHSSHATQNFGTGLGSFIEDIVERVTSAFADVTGPRHEFPAEHTGEFTGMEIPIRITTANGRVAIRAWDEPGFRAAVLVKAKGATEEEARGRAKDAYTIRADGAGFELEAQKHSFGDIAVDVMLSVPRDKRYRVEIKTGNGSAEVKELLVIDGRVTTGNGSLHCRGGQAESLLLRSGNGSIEVECDVADLEAKSGNGSISVTPVAARPQHLRCNTGNGSVRVYTRRLGPDAGIKVDAHTGIGSVNLLLPNLIYDRDLRAMGHKHVIARSSNLEGAAAPVTITARTGMGTITIE